MEEYFYNSCIIDINAFYQNLKVIEVGKILPEKLEELQETSKNLNRFFTINHPGFSKIRKYAKIANRIKMNPKIFKAYTALEQRLLLMYSVDPKLEAILIFEESNRIDQIKNNMIAKFGLYDPNLVKTEKWFIKHFLSEENKNKIQEEIDRRVFK